MNGNGACSCGELAVHRIARRRTADGKDVLLWSDGSLTWALGFTIRGSARPRTPVQVDRALRAGWLVLGEVEMHDSGEVSALVVAARKVADRGGIPGDVRAEMSRAEDPTMPGGWTVIACDWKGRATCRAWEFPRLSRYHDCVIWNERGRFEVMTRGVAVCGLARYDRNTLAPTGRTATSLREAFALVRDTVVQ